MNKKIPLGVSACLLGDNVRYDGGHKRNTYICNDLAPFFEFRDFCPEVFIGLGIPREPIHLVATESGIECVGTKDASRNVTQQLKSAAKEQSGWLQNICGYIFKSNSPSCGVERVKTYSNGRYQRDGVGIFADSVMSSYPLLPVEEEGRLNDSILKENFIRRVYIYFEWKNLLEEGVTWKGLMHFHGRLKYVLYSHNQDKARVIGRALSKATKGDVNSFAQSYIADVMAVLALPATRKNHVNVLQHLQGYLKENVDALDKRELVRAIDDYRRGITPLIVPLELLRFMFKRHPNTYLSQSLYLSPYPKELGLLNLV